MNSSLKKRIVESYADLEHYGRHEDECTVREGEECNCGFENALDLARKLIREVEDF